MLLFFDIDGTIFDDQRNLPASVKPAMEEAGKNGHKLIINTGRTLCNMDHRLDDYPIDGWIMGCGTRVIYHGETLRRMEHSLSESLQLRSVFLKLEIPVVYECDTAMYFDPMVRPNKAIGGFREFAECHGIARDIDEEDIEFRIVKMFCFAKQERIQALKKQTEEIGIPYDAIDRGPDAWEIVPKGYSKGMGLIIFGITSGIRRMIVMPLVIAGMT